LNYIRYSTLSSRIVEIYTSPTFKLFGITILLPSLFLFYLQRIVFIERGFVFDIDFSLVLVAFLAGRLAAILLSLIVVLAGAIVIVAEIYFFDPFSFVRSAHFISQLSISDLTTTQWIIVVMALTSMIALPTLCFHAFKGVSFRHAAIPLFILILAPILDSLNGLSSIYNYKIGGTFIDQKLSGSFLSRLVQRGHQSRESVYVEPHYSKVKSASQELILDGNSNVVLIIVESWGLPFPTGANELITSNLMNLQDHYIVNTGSVPFQGGTTYAELRELCNAAADYKSIIAARDCLPQRLSRNGYKVIGLHGFSSKMFDRNLWWPKIGINNFEFAQQLSEKGLGTRCGAVFKGVCDHDIARLIHERLISTRDKQFIYWLTLNTHLPLPRDGLPKSTFECRQFGGSGDIHDDCRLAQFQKGFMDNIAAILSDANLPPTEFLLVGDHAPPFGDVVIRARYDNSLVPYIHLIPKKN